MVLCSFGSSSVGNCDCSVTVDSARGAGWYGLPSACSSDETAEAIFDVNAAKSMIKFASLGASPLKFYFRVWALKSHFGGVSA